MNNPHPALNNAQKQRRLDQAIEYVARAWFPANPEVLSRIKNRAEAGEYNQNFETLLGDIKSDFSIFTYLLKELRDHYPEQSERVDPITLMRSFDIQRLIKMIAVPSDSISRHSFLEMEKSQAARLKHFILGCSTSEMLADKTGDGVNSEQVFTFSVVRQLGLNLVAWNYPSIYGRVLQSVKDGAPGELDTLLSEQLGFEPIQLATALTLPAHIRSQYAEELGLPVSEPGASTADEKALVARKLCEIGEAFAILNDPENYPTGTSGSQTSITEIESILGPGGADKIRASVNSRYVSYLKVSPELAKLGISTPTGGKDQSGAYGKALSLRNPYLARLPEDLRGHISEVYRLVKKGQVSTEGIQKLSTEVLPAIGFPRGCIYLIEQHDLTLTPRLRIGNDSVKRYRQVSCLDETTGNPVVDAFSCSYPIKQMNTVFLGQRVSLIAGVLGVSERAGVLYLEMNEELAQNLNIDVLGVYKAFRQCMNDCLNLR